MPGTWGSQKKVDPMEFRVASFIVYKSQEPYQNFKIRHRFSEKENQHERQTHSLSSMYMYVCVYMCVRERERETETETERQRFIKSSLFG